LINHGSWQHDHTVGWQHDYRWRLATRLPHAVGNGHMVINDGWQHDRRWRLDTRLHHAVANMVVIIWLAT
jgi:hypothetical protein